MDPPQVRVGAENTDVEMAGVQRTATAQTTQELAVESTQTKPAEDLVTQSDPPPASTQQTSQQSFVTEKKDLGLKFLEYLTSPMVEIRVGRGDEESVLTAHQKLLVESPFLAQIVTKFSESGRRHIDLPDESVDAFGCFLQFLYTGDYLPLQTPEQGTRTADIDDSGEQLLNHAHVYTLAEKLGVPALKTLAHSKIHRIKSTARGEMAYARYVYQNTPAEDITIRKRVASFWASRSQVLRHEAEDEFRALCLDVPEFAFDVLSLVLDYKEKRTQERAEAESSAKGSGRKRLRSGL